MDIEDIIKLRNSGLTLKQISEKTEIPLSTLKRKLRKVNSYLTSEQRTQNAQNAKLEKNSDPMAHMRSKITEDSRKRAGATAVEYYKQHPERAIQIGERTQQMWDNMSDEDKAKLAAKKSPRIREAKLKMTLEEYDILIKKIQARAGAKVGLVTPIARSLGLNACTTLKEFHRRNLDHLIKKSQMSQGQTEVYEYVKSLVPDLEVVYNDRTRLEGLELDIYIPSANFGIEYNGLYHHSDKVGNPPNHTKKYKKCKDNNVNMLVVFEDEWDDPLKRELICSMIRHRLGIKGIKKRASKLILKEVEDKPLVKAFFQLNHLEGNTAFTKAYGLFDGDDLISCMSIRTPYTKSNKGMLEIARFASSHKYTVYGAASKLLAALPNDKDIISYSDNRLSHGSVYSKNGFTEETLTSEPSYWYTDFNTRLWRTKCQRINDPEILKDYPTERAQAAGGVFSRIHLGHDGPLFKIEGYGQRRWVKKKP